jgi:hypothetical protein
VPISGIRLFDWLHRKAHAEELWPHASYARQVLISLWVHKPERLLSRLQGGRCEPQSCLPIVRRQALAPVRFSGEQAHLRTDRYLLQQFNGVGGVNFTDAELTKYRTIPLSTIVADPEGATKIIAALTWMEQQIERPV